MAHVNKFEKKLNKLFKDRTFKLRSKLGLKQAGPKPKITRKKVNDTISELQDLASTILARGLAASEFDQNAGKKKRRSIVGRGWKNQKKLFDAWFQSAFPNKKDLVYVFWNKEKCIYVGRTGKGGSRPSSHFHKKWCKITRADIYPTNSKSHSPKLECLAVHRFEPSVNSYKPSSKKWTRKCPLCAVHKQIEIDLRTIFRIKRKRSILER